MRNWLTSINWWQPVSGEWKRFLVKFPIFSSFISLLCCWLDGIHYSGHWQPHILLSLSLYYRLSSTQMNIHLSALHTCWLNIYLHTSIELLNAHPHNSVINRLNMLKQTNKFKNDSIIIIWMEKGTWISFFIILCRIKFISNEKNEFCFIQIETCSTCVAYDLSLQTSRTY